MGIPEFDVVRTSTPTSPRAPRRDPGRPGLRPVLHRPHGAHRLDADGGWGDGAVVPYAPLALDPATMALHYGQLIFEGLKAYRAARRLDRDVPAGA